MGGTTGGGDALGMRGVTFTYAGATVPALLDVTLTVPKGAFALLVGGTGAGKSTLLRLATPALAPAGHRMGDVRVFGRDAGEPGAVAAGDVGLVLQDGDAQLVCEDVRSEMAFGLENLALPQAEMARRIAETATFLGMVPWFGRRVSELSGGQRQTLALAATLAMRPRLLLLDEPVAQLDPVAASAFAALVGRANRELGITVIVATHGPTAFVPYATCAFAVDGGRVAAMAPHDAPGAGAIEPAMVRAGGLAPEGGVDLKCADGGSDAVAAGTDDRRSVGGSVGSWHGGGGHGTRGMATPAQDASASDATGASRTARAYGVAVAMRDLWFCHGRTDAWVFSGLDLTLCSGGVHVLLGGNGSGKTTLLRLVAGALRPQRGRVRNECADAMGYLPQGVRALIGCESVRDELMAWSASVGYGEPEAHACLGDLGISVTDELLGRHPYDLSGGQQRLLAMAKVLLTHPRLLLLDEPTVGLDLTARAAVARAIATAAAHGATVIMATHDVTVARAVGTTATLLFDGRPAVNEPADDFFAHAWLWGA